MLVRTLRLERAWTQEQLALVLGVNVRTVQRLEGGATPSLETAQALAGTFGCDAALFLTKAAATLVEPVEVPPPVRYVSAANLRATTPAPRSALKQAKYAAACLLVGGGLASILILALLIAGPSSPALIPPPIVSAMCVAMLICAPLWRRDV